MNTAPPTSSSGGNANPLGFLQSLLGNLRPPEWMVDELQNRVVLFLNHVLMQEPQAQERLKRQKGKPVKVQWGEVHLTLAATAAGLLERPAAGAAAPARRQDKNHAAPAAHSDQLYNGKVAA